MTVKATYCFVIQAKFKSVLKLGRQNHYYIIYTHYLWQASVKRFTPMNKHITATYKLFKSTKFLIRNITNMNRFLSKLVTLKMNFKIYQLVCHHLQKECSAARSHNPKCWHLILLYNRWFVVGFIYRFNFQGFF